MDLEASERLKNKTVIEICELVETQARIIHKQQELIELLTNNKEHEEQ